jgi:hypothetical protein
MLAPREKLWAAPPALVDAALSLLDLGPEDVLADYGCGDGPALFAAVRRFAVRRALGYEIHAPRAEALRAHVEAEGLADRITVLCANALDAEPGEATAVYLYLIARGLTLMLPVLRRAAEAQPGGVLRVVTVLYRIPGVQHERCEKVKTSELAVTPCYVYKIRGDSGLAGAGAGAGGERGEPAGAGGTVEAEEDDDDAAPAAALGAGGSEAGTAMQ